MALCCWGKERQSFVNITMPFPSKIKTGFALLSNIAISVIIVLLNKWIYQTFKFPNITLTCVHFLVTSIGMEAAKRANIFHVKSLPMKDMLLLSMSFCGFVVLTNLSLQANTVGTYQISKFMTTPCVILIQTVFFNKTFSWKVKLTLVSINLALSVADCSKWASSLCTCY